MPRVGAVTNRDPASDLQSLPRGQTGRITLTTTTTCSASSNQPVTPRVRQRPVVGGAVGGGLVGGGGHPHSGGHSAGPGLTGSISPGSRSGLQRGLGPCAGGGSWQLTTIAGSHPLGPALATASYPPPRIAAAAASTATQRAATTMSTIRRFDVDVLIICFPIAVSTDLAVNGVAKFSAMTCARAVSLAGHSRLDRDRCNDGYRWRGRLRDWPHHRGHQLRGVKLRRCPRTPGVSLRRGIRAQVLAVEVNVTPLLAGNVLIATLGLSVTRRQNPRRIRSVRRFAFTTDRGFRKRISSRDGEGNGTDRDSSYECASRSDPPQTCRDGLCSDH